MKQQTFASQASIERYGRKSMRELFLGEMERVVPWSELESLVEPHYAHAGRGRPPVGSPIMLRVYFVQQWFNLSDPGVEEALYEPPALRRFMVGPSPADQDLSGGTSVSAGPPLRTKQQFVVFATFWKSMRWAA